MTATALPRPVEDALTLAEAGLIYFYGAPGEWEIQGRTHLGTQVAEEYEARRKL